MSKYFSAFDKFAIVLTQHVIRYKYLVLLLAVAIAVAIGSGVKKLSFSNNYRVFFSSENPELTAFENFQASYTKNDNFLFVLEPKKGNVFTQNTLSAVESLTHSAWQIPFANRVDSISNFQHTYSNNDDLVVEELIIQAESLSAEQLKQKSLIALNEPLLVGQLVSADGSATAINITLQYPGKSLKEVPAAVAKARQLKQQLEKDYPDIEVSLTGFSMLNNAFAEAGFLDAKNLIPIMYLLLLIFIILTLRSILCMISILLVLVASVVVGMGFGGHSGILLTPISNTAAIVILTLAIADSVHILITLKKHMKEGLARNEALLKAMQFNFLPVTITSITTIVGFLALNFSDAPPYWHLGNMSAVGIAAAWLFSITLLPALVAILPFRVKVIDKSTLGDRMMTAMAAFVTRNARSVIVTTGVVCLGFMALIPNIEFNDQWSDYFSEKIEFRRDTDQATKKFGLYPIEYSVEAKGSQGIAEPEYLAKLEEFAQFLRQQPQVTHVFSITDIMKRLNKNMHGDDSAYYKIPTDKQQAAQYLLLYELSLPYGLDLNDRINIDKSASRLTVMLGKTSTQETKAFLYAAEQWIRANLPQYMQAKATSAQVMFTYIADRNVQSMITGTITAVLAIAVIMMLALRSISMGLLSLVPNCLPILVAFGLWSLLVGTIGFSIAAVAAISLGLVVDDTVHFLTKYTLARNEKSFTVSEAVEYAMRGVGLAILINTIILLAGFIVMASSTFKINADLGLLTALTIGLALILDFLLLPALLVLFDKKTESISKVEDSIASDSTASSITASFLTVIVAGFIFAPESLMAETKSAKQQGYEISARSDRSDRGFKDSEVNFTMVLHNAAGAESRRTLRMKTLEVPNENLGDKSIVMFQTPSDIKGMALLSHSKILEADDQWLYLPSIKRVKRISSRNKSGPFVGSEFAFEDFTAQELNKYSHLWLKTENCGELVCDVVEREPLYEYSGYSKLLVWIDQKVYQVRKVEFYDRRGDKLKTLTFSGYKNFQGYWRAMKLKMVNHLTHKHTDLIYDQYSFNLGLKENDFVKSKLRRIK